MEPASVLEPLVGLERDHDQGESPGLRLANACVDLVAVGGAGIMLMDHGGNGSSLGLSDLATGLVEGLPFTLGEGPGIDAHGDGLPVLEPSLDAMSDDRWPAFAPAAVDVGFLGAFGFPLHMGTVCLGALDLYRSEER